MEVKAGYKQTEVGIIPSDWEVTTIGNVSDTSSGTTPSRSMMERFYNNGTIAWVKTLDLNNSEIFSTDENVTQAAINETSLRVYPVGTVLVAMYGGFNQIGRTGLLRIPATINQALTAIRPNAKILSSQYLLRVLNYRVGYWKAVASSSRKDPNITGKDVRDFPLAYPQIEEQEAIAEALSDADALIEALEGLIAKKRQVKQGAMQELLTGKRRLPGFNGEWKTSLLESILEKINNGFVYKPSTSSAYPITRIETISDGQINYDRVGFAQKSRDIENYRLQHGDILFSHINSVEHIGKVAFYEDERPLYHGMNLILLRSKSSFGSKFLYYWLSSEYGRRISKSLAKQAINQASINTSELKQIEIKHPELPEQTAIAEILSDMDAEITALEAKLSKARLVKQGMMHELLTGRIRLV